MTPADIVAEAIAFAKGATSDRVRNHPRTTWLSGDVEGMTVLDPVRYHRDDVVDAALAHLVARVVGAEGRAKTAEADLRRMETRALTFGAALQGIAASGDDKPTNASMFAEAVLLVEKNAEKEAPRG